MAFTRFFNLFNALKDIEEMSLTIKKRHFKVFSKKKMLKRLFPHCRSENAPVGLSFNKFLKTMDGFYDKKFTWSKEYKGHTYKTFFIFGMHFMDAYNYDLQRIRRCAGHYSAADGRIYPFCTYNSGYTFRKRIEEKYIESKKI